MPKIQIKIDRRKLSDFCSKWKIREFSLFGSVLREDFGPKSDVDVLVAFSPEAHWSFFDLVGIKKDLERIVGRDVDFVTRKAIEASRNPIRRKAILSSFVTLHAA